MCALYDSLMCVVIIHTQTACAEGCALGVFSYDKLKNKEKRKKAPNITLIK